MSPSATGASSIVQVDVVCAGSQVSRDDDGVGARLYLCVVMRFAVLSGWDIMQNAASCIIYSIIIYVSSEFAGWRIIWPGAANRERRTTLRNDYVKIGFLHYCRWVEKKESIRPQCPRMMPRVGLWGLTLPFAK